MSEKLTKDEIIRMVSHPIVPDIWARIESDREAVRAETREEVLKDHFKGGERLLWTDDSHKEHSGRFGFIEDGSEEVLTYGASGSDFRRPAKKRPMTREEKIKKLKERFANQYAWLPDELKEPTLDDLCRIYNIPTEVEE